MKSDTIMIRGLKVFAYHGVTEEEREHGQEFLIDIDIGIDATDAALTDDLQATIDYASAAEAIERIATKERYYLIETLASRIADHLLSLDGVGWAEVTVKKPQVPLSVPVDWVGVSVRRERDGAPGRED